MIKFIKPDDIYSCKVKFGNTRTMYEMCSEIWIQTGERCQWHCSSVFFVHTEQISHIAVVFLLLTLNKQMPFVNNNAVKS